MIKWTYSYPRRNPWSKKENRPAYAKDLDHPSGSAVRGDRPLGEEMATGGLLLPEAGSGAESENSDGG